jgi:hypothetical protein
MYFLIVLSFSPNRLAASRMVINFALTIGHLLERMVANGHVYLFLGVITLDRH